MSACDKNRDGHINAVEFEKYFKTITAYAFALHRAKAQKAIEEALVEAEKVEEVKAEEPAAES